MTTPKKSYIPRIDPPPQVFSNSGLMGIMMDDSSSGRMAWSASPQLTGEHQARRGSGMRRRVVSTLGMYLSSNADATDWPAYYNLHPLYVDKNGTGAYNVSDPAEVARVLGGEGCMWGETANGDNLNLRLWPNAAALAESLWSGEGGNETEALPRLLRHRCRMRQRGVPVTPLQPGFC